MTPRLRLANAARILTPAVQGTYDGLCGLYAIINAIDLVLHPRPGLKPHQHRRLFASGIRYLSRKRQLHTVIVRGMTCAMWTELAVHVLSQHPDLGARTESLPIGPDAVSATRAIIGALKHGWPVALLLDHTYEHFTVICGYSPKRFQLFDSRGYRSIDQASMSISCAKPVRHRITPSAVLVFMRA